MPTTTGDEIDRTIDDLVSAIKHSQSSTSNLSIIIISTSQKIVIKPLNYHQQYCTMNIAPRSKNTVKGNSRGRRGLGFLPPSLHPLGIAIGVGCGLLFSGGFNRCLNSNEVDLEPKIPIRGSHANGNDKNFALVKIPVKS